MIKIKNPGRHVWEGWTVKDFIKEIEIFFDAKARMVPGYWSVKTKVDIDNWCMDEQPYYKQHIPEVADYFYRKSRLN